MRTSDTSPHHRHSRRLRRRCGEVSEVLIERELLRATPSSCVHTSLCVIPHTLLEEVRLPLQRDQLHEVERVSRTIVLHVAEGIEKAVCTELDVLPHQLRVHSDQPYR